MDKDLKSDAAMSMDINTDINTESIAAPFLSFLPLHPLSVSRILHYHHNCTA